MKLERLRLAGFKSFVEPTELAIEPGLTGIVGPNGCGKSNLVEALRWVMGESSARRLRGGEMDDVIFAGSDSRPARNVAEVALTLDNRARDAAFAHNDSATIEVVRRLVRGAGSAFRINGREARAQDVQLLFADAASGPHSGALVGQGRVGGLIAAKPGERRMLLDEAAGTAGLHARRHEAELKLQAAEANLSRLDDVTATLQAQIEALKKQARQATRYRRLGEQIRNHERRLLALRWEEAAAAAQHCAGELQAAEAALAAATEAALTAGRVREAAEAAVPPLRLEQAATAASLQRLAASREALDQELARAAAAQDEAERRRAQLAADAAREAERLNDAETALARLAEEQGRLEADAGSAQGEAEAAASRAETAATALIAAEKRLQQVTEEAAAAEARRGAAERRCRELAEREARLAARLGDAERQLRALRQNAIPAEALADAAAAVASAEAAGMAAREAMQAAGEAVAAAQPREAAASEAAREAERALAALTAEAGALQRLIAPQAAAAANGRQSMLAQVQVPPGCEAAVAALFDGELAAPALSSDERPRDCEAGWVALPAIAGAALPERAQLLAGIVVAPPALARRLAQTGLVADEAEGWRLQACLVAGQSLVDRDGRLWRWDGFVRLAPGSLAAAEQFRQRNRLIQLESEIEAAKADADESGKAAAAARAARDAARAAERAAHTALRAAEERLSSARAAEAELARRRLEAETRLAAAADAVERLAAEREELAAQRQEAGHTLAELPEPALTRDTLETARAEATAARRQDGEARGLVERLAREEAARHQRLAAIEGEAGSWRNRHQSAAVQRASLAERRAALAAEIEALAGRPAQIAEQRAALTAQAAAAAADLQRSEAALAAAEARLRSATEAARQADEAVATARETRASLAARHEATMQNVTQMRSDINERLREGPEALFELPADSDAAPPAPDELAARLDRLVRERDAMGPVNLLAEREAGEVAARLAELDHERADLTAAIAQLRRGIATLDAEGRKRLVAAFERLNGNFAELFARLFGGGKAELAWTGGGDDPLTAGLEIMASPPGKRLQALSLLSGGEQALTALALIFAVFLTRPAPVCVLDEVDAPLDDSNVDAFCRLVAEIADSTGTRFLLITHHRVTMARMDRLFGVTMAERGVSQLVSVDLARAAALRQTA
jgi:chromosome segregation protein